MKGRTVRRILRRPEIYLTVLALVILVVTWDSGRRPENQVTARLYIAVVRAYETALGPVLARAVQCRFRPTCSRYSIEAVQRFGVRRGMTLTVARVLSCRPSVPLGTFDPVPPASRGAE